MSTAAAMPCGVIVPARNWIPKATRRASGSADGERGPRPKRSIATPAPAERCCRRPPRAGALRQPDFGLALERPFAVDLIDQAGDLAHARIDLGAQRAEVRGGGLGVAARRFGVGEDA